MGVKENNDKRLCHFIDADGVLCRHHSRVEDYPPIPELLPGVLEFLTQLKEANCYTVLTTGRSREEARPLLKLLKDKIGFRFDQCVYNLPTAERYLWNDTPNDEPKAIAYNMVRNKGFNKK